MGNRREFLRQSALTLGSFVFIKPSKGLGITADNSLQYEGRLSILNLHNFLHDGNISTTKSILASITTAYGGAGVQNPQSLLLATGHLVNESIDCKIISLKKLTSLKNKDFNEHAMGANFEKGVIYSNAISEELILPTLKIHNQLLPHQVVSKGNLKVGIIGNGTIQDCNITSKEIAKQLDETASHLRSNYNCHLIISMNPFFSANSLSCSKNIEKEIVAFTKEIDVVVSSNSTIKPGVTYILRNAVRHEVIVSYPGNDNSGLRCFDISFNSQMKKIDVSVRRVV